jgi:hypothetical protein
LEDEEIVTNVNLLVDGGFVWRVNVNWHVGRAFLTVTAADLAWSCGMLDICTAKEVELINSSLCLINFLFIHFWWVKIQKRNYWLFCHLLNRWRVLVYVIIGLRNLNFIFHNYATLGFLATFRSI